MVLIPYEQYLSRKDIVAETPITDTLNEKQISGTEQNFSDKLSEQLVLKPFNKQELRNVETILSYVKDKINWNKKGEIIVDDKVVEGSHITDLLKDSLYNYKNFEPTGVKLFYAKLKNVPQCLIKNVKRIPLIGNGDEVTPPTKKHKAAPPPGIPVGVTPIDITKERVNSTVPEIALSVLQNKSEKNSGNSTHNWTSGWKST